MRTDEELYDEKRAFIKDKLLPLVQAIDDTVKEAIYCVVESASVDLEYVQLYYKNGSNRRIYVTADSLLALARDVLREL